MEERLHLMNDVETADKKYYVSTIELNTHCNTPTILYETMIFPYNSKGVIEWKGIYSERCFKPETAIERHNYIILNIKEFIERK